MDYLRSAQTYRAGAQGLLQPLLSAEGRGPSALPGGVKLVPFTHSALGTQPLACGAGGGGGRRGTDMAVFEGWLAWAGAFICFHG